MVRVTFSGDDFDGFAIAGPTGHVRIFFPPDGERTLTLPIADAGGGAPSLALDRSRSRVYTPRRWDIATQELEVDVVVHGAGPGSQWAAAVRPGDGVLITGPSAGGAYHPDPQALWFVLGGDEAALPAIATILEALPPSVRADVYVEVQDGADEQPLASRADVNLTWVHRAWANEAPGEALVKTLQTATLPAGAGRVWVACEATAMRAIRRHLLTDRGMERSAIFTHGYWRQGAANHPDHDQGDEVG